MPFDGHVHFLQLNVGRQGNVADAAVALDVLSFQTIDDGAAHDGHLVLGLLDQRVSLNEMWTHVEVEFDNVALLPFAGDAEVGILAVHLHRILVTPIGLMQLDGLQVLCVLDGKGNLSVPRVVGRLFHFQVFGLQGILPIKVDIECLSTDGISILLCLTEGTKGVGRTAEARDVMLTVLRPAHGVREFLGTAQRLRIEEVFTINGNAREDAVVEFVLNIVDIFGVTRCLEHTP